jgi:DNA-directed RNA polymerase subunit E'/Rpb7
MKVATKNNRKPTIIIKGEDDDTSERIIIKTESKKKQNVEESINLVTNLHLPYIDTVIVSPIMLQPNQMDNKMYLHLKTNLSNKLLNKCYQNYGYIKTIYKIEEVSEGVIEPEDPSCSAKMILKFSCRLCLPIKNKEIICKIDRMNKALISAINGPIKVIITPEKICKDTFFSDRDRNIRIKKTSEVVTPNMFIKIIVLSLSFSNYDNEILSIGFMQDIATTEEIEKYYDKQ